MMQLPYLMTNGHGERQQQQGAGQGGQRRWAGRVREGRGQQGEEWREVGEGGRGSQEDKTSSPRASDLRKRLLLLSLELAWNEQ